MELDAQFWLAVSFLILIAGTFKPVSKMLRQMLDQHSQQVKIALEEALTSKEEAELLLVTAKKKQKDIEEDIETILQNAKQEADRAYTLMISDYEEVAKKRLDMLEQKLFNQHRQLLETLCMEAVENALLLVKETLQTHTDEALQEHLLKQSLQAIATQSEHQKILELA